ncbi:hypothetical protein [Clostridium sp. JS66]|uniref:hypothetical protein n=1 Tax=Clostridium sp. JS66 TaxID=3064705 RepID=UPI00298D60AC|nr:hypothetical protein [Clostridium sp. JS66]WPC39421.1 hypothetical protein Q6H37_16025 [Clostridium sp. JS66]
MSACINNVCNQDSYLNLATSKNQSTSKDEDEVQKKKKRQIVSEQQGKYYCTYIVSEDGKKTLLRKIPIDKVKNQNNSQGLFTSNEIKHCSYEKTDQTVFAILKYKNQFHSENFRKQNIKLQDMISMLKGTSGI